MRALLVVPVLLLGANCGPGNHFLWGEVEADAGPFHIRVTDCYQTHVNPPIREAASAYRFEPCKDARILIRDQNLYVNGASYGKVRPGAKILVDHGAVSVRNL